MQSVIHHCHSVKLESKGFLYNKMAMMHAERFWIHSITLSIPLRKLSQLLQHPPVRQTVLQMLTVVCSPCLSLNTSEPTDHQPAGLHREEDDPNLHPSPNPRCPSAKLCTRTTLRTQTSSASMLMTLLILSKRVSMHQHSVQVSHISSYSWYNIKLKVVI